MENSLINSQLNSNVQNDIIDKMSQPPFFSLCDPDNQHSKERCRICDIKLNIFSKKTCRFCGHQLCSDHLSKKRKDPSQSGGDAQFHPCCMKCDKKYLQHRLNLGLIRQLNQIKRHRLQAQQEQARQTAQITSKTQHLDEQHKKIQQQRIDFEHRLKIINKNISKVTIQHQKLVTQNQDIKAARPAQKKSLEEMELQIQEQERKNEEKEIELSYLTQQINHTNSCLEKVNNQIYQLQQQQHNRIMTSTASHYNQKINSNFMITSILNKSAAIDQSRTRKNIKQKNEDGICAGQECVIW